MISGYRTHTHKIHLFPNFRPDRDRMVVGSPLQSVSFIINVVSSNPVLGEVYSIQHYVIKFVNDFATCRWFSPGIPVSATNTTDHHHITEILLKVALNTIILTIIFTVSVILNFYSIKVKHWNDR